MECDESVVIMSAIRYMCGRYSYGVGCVIDYVVSKKEEFTQSEKEVIERDIKQRIKEFPKTPYKKEWLEMVETINKINL